MEEALGVEVEVEVVEEVAVVVLEEEEEEAGGRGAEGRLKLRPR